MISDELLEKLARSVRIKSESAKEEVRDLAEACILDLEIAGVYVIDEDPLCEQAIKLYCKAHYGYDEDSERFGVAYAALRDSMALSGDYPKKVGDSDG